MWETYLHPRLHVALWNCFAESIKFLISYRFCIDFLFWSRPFEFAARWCLYLMNSDDCSESRNNSFIFTFKDTLTHKFEKIKVELKIGCCPSGAIKAGAIYLIFSWYIPTCFHFSRWLINSSYKIVIAL
jgi:hypothetical protein